MHLENIDEHYVGTNMFTWNYFVFLFRRSHKMASFHSSVASCVRVMSPQRCKLLPQIPQGRGIQSHRLTRPFPHSSVDHESATVFCTSCRHCHSATSQSVAGQVNTPSEKSQGTDMPSRLKNNVGSLISGLGNFATNLPSRVAEEINRFSWHSDKTKVAATSGEIKVKVMKPLYEESIKDSISQTAALKNVDSPSKVLLQEQRSFAEAMQDTHSSVVSYYTSSTSSDEVKPSKTNQNVITTQDKKPSKDEENSWNVFRQFSIPLPFLEIGSGQEAKKKPLMKANIVSRSDLEMRTRALVAAIKTASSVPSQLKRLEDLCKHLINYPSMRTLATNVSYCLAMSLTVVISSILILTICLRDYSCSFYFFNSFQKSTQIFKVLKLYHLFACFIEIALSYE